MFLRVFRLFQPFFAPFLIFRALLSPSCVCCRFLPQDIVSFRQNAPESARILSHENMSFMGIIFSYSQIKMLYNTVFENFLHEIMLIYCKIVN